MVRGGFSPELPHASRPQPNPGEFQFTFIFFYLQQPQVGVCNKLHFRRFGRRKSKKWNKTEKREESESQDGTSAEPNSCKGFITRIESLHEGSLIYCTGSVLTATEVAPAVLIACFVSV